MPIYEYRCSVCGNKLQKMQGMNDNAPDVCPYCGSKESLRKIISQTSFVLNGTGWYVTDYKPKAKDSNSHKENSDKKTKSDKKSENKSKIA